MHQPLTTWFCRLKVADSCACSVPAGVLRAQGRLQGARHDAVQRLVRLRDLGHLRHFWPRCEGGSSPLESMAPQQQQLAVVLCVLSHLGVLHMQSGCMSAMWQAGLTSGAAVAVGARAKSMCMPRQLVALCAVNDSAIPCSQPWKGIQQALSCACWLAFWSRSQVIALGRG